MDASTKQDGRLFAVETSEGDDLATKRNFTLETAHFGALSVAKTAVVTPSHARLYHSVF